MGVSSVDGKGMQEQWRFNTKKHGIKNKVINGGGRMKSGNTERKERKIQNGGGHEK